MELRACAGAGAGAAQLAAWKPFFEGFQTFEQKTGMLVLRLPQKAARLGGSRERAESGEAEPR